MLSGSESSTLSEHTLSPFSDESQRSEPTSDETPDLGAFTTVFHALNNLQPVVRPRIHVPNPRGFSQPTFTIPPTSASLPTESSFPSTARPDKYYFTISHDYAQDDDETDDDDQSEDDHSLSSPFSAIVDDEDSSSDEIHLFHLESDDDTEFVQDGPSLGQLDQALSFLAAERAKWSADRSRPAANGGPSPGKKKRRRKRPPTIKASSLTPRACLTDAEDDGIGGRSSSASSHPPDELPSTQLKPPTSHLSRREKRRLKQLSSGNSISVIDVSTINIVAPVPTSPTKSKKGKGKRLLHLSRSTPQLRTTASQLVEEEPDPVHPNPEVEKLRKLARKLQGLFPADKQFLNDLLSGTSERKSGLTLPSTSPLVNDLDTETDGPTISTREFIDIRGPSPKAIQASPVKRNPTSNRGKGRQKDKSNHSKDKEDDSPPEKLIHVFIDHSNILIGLLSWLKRHPKKFANLPLPPRPANNNVHQRSQSYTTQNPYPQLHHYHSTPNTHSIVNPHQAFVSSDPSSSSPATSLALDASSDSTSYFPSPGNPQTRPLKPTNHLSHPALALILERGRPISRRVVVTSSPLYQPMDGAERLGYEVRIFMRVPDFGDGMDRERSAAKAARHGRSISLGAPGAPALPTIHPTAPTINEVQGSFPATLKDPQWTSSSASGSTTSGAQHHHNNNNNNRHNKRHQRQKGSTSTSTESDVVLGHQPSTPPQVSPIGGMPLTPQKIKYREQGVDELLQLKLHQAIASADELPYPLPPGSTIVLATGDGNVGQFNEDGFLGSVRTALRRGWEVELYAWEVGLSKRWAKEFGLGKKGGEYEGRFRVIGLEQFGEQLVERSWW